MQHFAYPFGLLISLVPVGILYVGLILLVRVRVVPGIWPLLAPVITLLAPSRSWLAPIILPTVVFAPTLPFSFSFPAMPSVPISAPAFSERFGFAFTFFSGVDAFSVSLIPGQSPCYCEGCPPPASTEQRPRPLLGPPGA